MIRKKYWLWKMNEFISPHQNININISYNLHHQQQDKIPKVVFGKKISKVNKNSDEAETEINKQDKKNNADILVSK